MRVISILLFLNGIVGITLGSMMYGDISAATMIGAASSILSGIGFMIPAQKTEQESKEVLKTVGRKKKVIAIFAGVSVLFILLIVGFAIAGTGKGKVSHEEFLSEDQFQQLYTDTEPFIGYQVDFNARVFQDPDRTAKYLSFQVYADNDINRNTIVRLDDPNADINKGDIIHIVGQVHGIYKGKNIFGAVIKAPAIIARKVEKADYATAFAPTIKTINVAQKQDQNGFVINVEKVELAQKETRVYLKVTNESSDPIDFYGNSAVLIQDKKQFGELDSFESNYPEIKGDSIQPGVSTEGIVVFEPVNLDGDNFNAIFKGSSDNWEVRTKPFTFEIPLKRGIVPKTNESQSLTDSNTSVNGAINEELPTQIRELIGAHYYSDPNNSLNNVSVTITDNIAKGAININTLRDKVSLIEFSGEVVDGAIQAEFEDDGWGESGRIVLSLSEESATLDITVNENAESSGWGVYNSSYVFESNKDGGQ